MESLLLKPIGNFRGSYQERYLLPRQGTLDSQEGAIELLPHSNFEQALHDLDGFERIWILYWFHLNQNWRPKVQPPRGSIKRGVFATRSPHRPNPIGLTAAKLLSIKGRYLLIADHDLIDNTPILDIKPYLIYADAHPNARQGWVDQLPLEAPYAVNWSPYALSQEKWLQKQNFSLLQPISTLLKNPLPQKGRRIRYIHCPEQLLELSFKTWRLHYQLQADKREVLILSIHSGYQLPLDPMSNDYPLHHAFHCQFPPPFQP